jgi:hypothetical protein
MDLSKRMFSKWPTVDVVRAPDSGPQKIRFSTSNIAF